MAKPIFIVGLPIATMQEIAIVEEKANSLLSEEYHVLVINTKQNELTFKVFYEKDFDEIKFNELKEIVKKGLL